MKQRIFESLRTYCGSDFYPFHMPGHKRNVEDSPLAEFYQYDITEIDGFDNLHQPEGLIKQAQERAAKLYHSEETYFLVNGSTAGILSAVSALAVRGKKLIISRNCHKAVYHAAFLNRMELHYVYPQRLEEYEIAGAVTKEEIKREIENIINENRMDAGRSEVKNPQELIAGVVITSPTYDGIISDVKEIARLVHSYGIPLIVDQAHGAHFGLHPGYPANAVSEGADLVIHSVHKTLPAPTQTALLHRNGELTDGELLRRYLRIYQSSSPSYLLIAGIDEGVFQAEREGKGRLDQLLCWRNSFLKKAERFRHIQVCPFTEPGRLVIFIKDFPMSGQQFYDILREKYHLQMEMAAGSYVVAILTMMDREEGIQRLLTALQEIDTSMSAAEKNDKGSVDGPSPIEAFRKEKGSGWERDLRPHVNMNIWEAYRMPFEEIALEEAEGRTAAEFINLYPPGIPLSVPGERIEKQLSELVSNYLAQGYTVQGVCDNKVKVLMERK